MKGSSKFSFGLGYAFAGLLYAIKYERNFKIHLVAMLLAVVFGLFLGLSKYEWFAVIILSGVVMQAELVNSAIEKLLDYIKPEIHPTAKIIKDVAAGSVLLVALAAFIIGVIIYVPKLIVLF